MSTFVGLLLIAAILAAGYRIIFQHSMARWGAVPDEVKADYPCDHFLEPRRPHTVRFTRAVAIMASPETVWPWIAQIGRGAGWYTYEWLDNEDKLSAAHLVDWIPAPRLGDCIAIGYLADLDPGRRLSYRGHLPVEFFGARMRLAITYQLVPVAYGTRVVVRLNTDFEGPTAWPVLRVFEILDFVMMQRQLTTLKQLVEGGHPRTHMPPPASSQDRDAYQAYETIYADGSTSGHPGMENARLYRAHVESSGLLG